MSDRKYRQRGYRDEPRAPRQERKPAEKKEYAPRGQPPTAPKTINMPGFREVVGCRGCGNELTVAVAWSAQQRLQRTWNRLETRAKRRTIIAVAAARELAGFCWAITRIQ